MLFGHFVAPVEQRFVLVELVLAQGQS